MPARKNNMWLRWIDIPAPCSLQILKFWNITQSFSCSSGSVAGLIIHLAGFDSLRKHYLNIFSWLLLASGLPSASGGLNGLGSWKREWSYYCSVAALTSEQWLLHRQQIISTEVQAFYFFRAIINCYHNFFLKHFTKIIKALWGVKKKYKNNF